MESEMSQSDKDKQHMISLMMWNLKNNINEQRKQKQTHRDREQTDDCQ